MPLKVFRYKQRPWVVYLVGWVQNLLNSKNRPPNDDSSFACAYPVFNIPDNDIPASYIQAFILRHFSLIEIVFF